MDDVYDSISRLKQTGVDVKYADVVLKACAVALREVPGVSVYFDGEKLRPSISSDIAIYFENYAEKMLTPLIKNIDRLRVTQISDQFRTIQSYVDSGDFRKLSFGPATFGFCDASADGLVEFASILKSPQSALLCLGQVTDQIGLDLKTTKRAVATLVYDNSAISDDIAAKFLNRLNDNISNCSRMLLGLSRQDYDNIESIKNKDNSSDLFALRI
uniref:2-oxoacid dehydrogenase acyltransferase catalytic domain-containing protein n=1 Tax=Romanomermis culicivorax TaxID=13658 RepID=A0A915I4X8_ROMCU